MFDEAEISSLVKATIDLLQYDHRTFSLSVGKCIETHVWIKHLGRGARANNDSLGAKLSLDQAPAGLVGSGKIDAVLTGASLFYTV